MIEYKQVRMTLDLGSESRYSDTPVFIAEGRLILSTFNRPTFTPAIENKRYTVTGATQNRLDVISQKFYGTPQLWWLIAFANNIIDPFTEVTAGIRLVIPPREEVWNKGR